MKDLKVLKTRIDTLERKSIILFIQKNPKTAAVIIVAIFVILNAWFVSDFRESILQLLGLPKDLIP
jgi:hypothetical protein